MHLLILLASLCCVFVTYAADEAWESYSYTKVEETPS